MSLCCLMVYDFKRGWSRFVEGRELYSDRDLEFGIAYAEGLLREGYNKEPFYKFDLRAFIVWARRQNENQGRSRR